MVLKTFSWIYGKSILTFTGLHHTDDCNKCLNYLLWPSRCSMISSSPCPMGDSVKDSSIHNLAKNEIFFSPCSLLSWTSCAESINLLCVFSIKETKSRVEYIGKGVRKFGQFKWYREDNWVLFGDFKVCQE